MAVAYSRPFLIKPISPSSKKRKKIAEDVIAFAKSYSQHIDDNHEVFNNYEILIKTDYDIMDTIKLTFLGQIQCLEVEFLDDTYIH